MLTGRQEEVEDIFKALMQPLIIEDVSQKI
jgi:hypothetical protein